MVNWKFIFLRVQSMTLGNISGLCTETVDASKTIILELGDPLLQVKFEKLTGSVITLNSRINRVRSNPLTIQLKDIDMKIDTLFAELKRTIKAGEKSSSQSKSNAASLLMLTFKPFWNVTTKPMASQSSQLEALFSRVNADQDMLNALATLDINSTWEELINTNILFNQIYDKRLEEDAAATAPSASSGKTEVVKDYEDFCKAIEVTLSALPSPKLELLFNEINELRKKYVPRRPLKLDAEHVSVEPVAAQKFTGKAITPLTKAIYKTGTETIDLLFGTDYTLTYKNNIQMGQATITLHGKGKYSGNYIVTFYIENEVGN
jgi:hypothetical protein